MATDASERDLTENGVTFKEKVMELKTVTTVNAWTKKRRRVNALEFINTVIMTTLQNKQCNPTCAAVRS